MFGKAITIKSATDLASDIAKLKEKVKELENKKEYPVVGEFYCDSIMSPRREWLYFRANNIIDEIDGYVKLKFAFKISSMVGASGEIKYTHTGGIVMFSSFWVKKDCLIWHNKDIYAKERKRIEEMADEGKR